MADVENYGLQPDILPSLEDNYSIVQDNTDIWNGELPYKPGTKFPTDSIIERATVSKTNKLIYNNTANDIYRNIISIFPEIDPMYGWQIREITTNLPYFKNAINTWVGLIAGDMPLIDIDSKLELELSTVIENSNFAETVQNEVRSRFIDAISAYRVDIDINEKPIIIPIEAKNLVVFVNNKMPSCIEVVVVFSIYTDEEGRNLIDFVEYHYNGLIRKHTMLYSDGTIGEYITDPVETKAFGGKYDISPITVFKHNVINNEIYGTDQLRYWSASMLAGMRELQNVLRLGERTREMIRKVPNSAIKKNPGDGSSVFFNKGTVGYTEGTDGKSPDIEYVVPEIRMEEAILALREAVKQIGMDTQLGVAFYSLDALGSRLSAESIRAAMFPARLEAQRIVTEMKPPMKELILKLGYIADIDISKSKLSIEFYDGFPQDEYNNVKAVQSRLESTRPSITLEDAIMKLDRVPLRIARAKAAEITLEYEKYKSMNQQNTGDNKNTSGGYDPILVNQIVPTEPDKSEKLDVDVDPDQIDEVAADIHPSTGIRDEISIKKPYIDNTVWDNQMYPKPRDFKV